MNDEAFWANIQKYIHTRIYKCTNVCTRVCSYASIFMKWPCIERATKNINAIYICIDKQIHTHMYIHMHTYEFMYIYAAYNCFVCEF